MGEVGEMGEATAPRRWPGWVWKGRAGAGGGSWAGAGGGVVGVGRAGLRLLEGGAVWVGVGLKG